MLEENFTNRIDKLFKQWDKPDSPGCALGIIQDGKIIYKKGYGMADLEHNVPITPKTIFTPGSISKQFTAMCILLLVEQKKISLDDDIRKYLPKFPDYDQTITIRHLIHHTSGIRDYGILVTLKGKNTLEMTNLPMHEVLRIVFKQKELNFTPGEDILYCNSGYLMLAAIIENVTGKTLREFAEENIFKPLGMKNTNFIDDNKYIIKNRAFSYIPNGNKGYFNAMVSHRHCGPGGVYSNLEDLFLWDQNYHHNKLGKKGQDLIKIMQTPGKLNNGEKSNYAFGLNVGKYKGQKRIYHAGGLAGYHSMYIFFPKYKFSVILLANIPSVMPGLLASKITDLFLEQFFKPEQPKISVDPNIYQNYSDSLGIVSISRRNHELIINLLGIEGKLIAETETSFFLEFPNSTWITFQKDDYSEFTLYLQGNESKIKRIESSKLVLKELKVYA